MKKIGQIFEIRLTEDGPTARNETVKIIVRENNGLQLVEVSMLDLNRIDTLNGQIAFFKEITSRLERFRAEPNSQ